MLCDRQDRDTTHMRTAPTGTPPRSRTLTLAGVLSFHKLLHALLGRLLKVRQARLVQRALSQGCCRRALPRGAPKSITSTIDALRSRAQLARIHSYC